MNNDETTKNNIVSTYSQIVSDLFCTSATSSCEASSQTYENTFENLMVKTYSLMGLPLESISDELLDSTKKLYDNLSNVCSVDCDSESSTYEELTTKMGALLANLGSQPTNELNQAAVNVIQARVVKASCDLGCVHVEV